MAELLGYFYVNTVMTQIVTITREDKVSQEKATKEHCAVGLRELSFLFAFPSAHG